MGDYPGAVEDSPRRLHSTPTTATLPQPRLLAAQAQGRFEAAIADYTRAIEGSTRGTAARTTTARSAATGWGGARRRLPTTRARWRSSRATPRRCTTAGASTSGWAGGGGGVGGRRWAAVLQQQLGLSFFAVVAEY